MLNFIRWRHLEPMQAGGGEISRFVCGYIACDPHLCRPILSGLPSMLIVNIRSSPSECWLESSIRHFVDEAGRARSRGCAEHGAHAQPRRASLDHCGTCQRGGVVAVRSGGAVRSLPRRTADGVPHALAVAISGTEAQLKSVQCGTDRRRSGLQIRGGIQPCIQARVRHTPSEIPAGAQARSRRDNCRPAAVRGQADCLAGRSLAFFSSSTRSTRASGPNRVPPAPKRS
jgi:hypothetical protein